MNGALTLTRWRVRASPLGSLACAVVRSAGTTHQICCVDFTVQSAQHALIE
jgi:hypothetical protein